MDKPDKLQHLRRRVARDWLWLPTGGLAHADCGIDQLTERPDRMKALTAWERLSGKRLGSKGVHAWLAAHLEDRQLFVAPGKAGPGRPGRAGALELVPVSSNTNVIAFARGRQVVVRSCSDVVQLLRAAEATRALSARRKSCGQADGGALSERFRRHDGARFHRLEGGGFMPRSTCRASPRDADLAHAGAARRPGPAVRRGRAPPDPGRAAAACLMCIPVVQSRADRHRGSDATWHSFPAPSCTSGPVAEPSRDSTHRDHSAVRGVTGEHGSHPPPSGAPG